jgi:hypothetical protein
MDTSRQILNELEKAILEMKAGLFTRRDFTRRDRRARQSWFLKRRRLG